MHLAFNGYFLNQPTTGTGQYTHHLLRELQELWDGDISVVIPGNETTERPEGFERCKFLIAKPPWPGGLGKVWFEYAAVTKAAQAAGADVLHVPYFGPPMGSNIPIVVTIHDLLQLVVPELKGGPLVRLYNQFAILGARHADFLVADSDYTQRDVERVLRVPSTQVQRVYLACESRFNPQPAIGEQERLSSRYGLQGEYLLYTGGLDLRKNVATLIRAYARAGVTTPLAIAGATRSRSRQFPDLQAVARSEGVFDRVQFLGWVEEDDKPALYRHCLAFVFPSSNEGFGLTPLEALACGAPVLCSNASSLPEVVGDAAATFDPHDIPALADLIRSVAHDPELRARLRAQGPLRAQRFSWRTTAEQTIEAYHRAIAVFHGTAA